jgi:hypothetical protein
MTYFKSGTWNCICHVCGGQFKSDEILKRWDGHLVCRDDFEVRHIADFLRPITEKNTIPFVSPEPTDSFIYICYLEQSQGRADVGEADCARADITLPMFTY